VNFHGATLPRGWSRTWPNLMTAEAVRGLEFTTFDQADQDAVVRHAAMLPFTRNLFDPMDFTPMVFGDIPKIKRATRNGFELAESVLFLSGIQHFAETPEGMATAPAYVKTFLQRAAAQLGRREVRGRLSGQPRRHRAQGGKAWYVAGINADDSRPAARPRPGPSSGKGAGTLITDGATEREFTPVATSRRQDQHHDQAHGGFVAVFK
jgi:alpha-glucosidase